MIYEGKFANVSGRIFLDENPDNLPIIVVDLTGDVDTETDSFCLTISGEGAYDFVEQDRSCEGTSWESDGNDFAYVYVSEKEDRGEWAREYFEDDVNFIFVSVE